MLVTFRIGDSESVTVNCVLQPPGPNSAQDGPELASAALSDTKLSRLSESDVFGLVAQIVDYFSRDQGPPKGPGDWYTEWLASTANGD